MNSQKFKVRSVACALGIAGSLVGSSAFAITTSHLADKSWSTGFGNDNVGVTVDLRLQERVTNMSGLRIREVGTLGWFDVSAKLFGASFQPLYVSPNATGAVNTSKVNTRSATANVFIMNDIIYSDGNIDCGSKRLCASYDTSVSKTLFNRDQRFFIGPIPVIVSGRLVGSLHGGVSSAARSEPYLGLTGTMLGATSGTMNAGAALTARFSAGFDAVIAGAGLTASFDVLTTDVTPNAGQRAALTDNATTGTYQNRTTLAITSMRGSASVWGQVFGIQYEDEIVRWDAPFSWTDNLWDLSGAI